jgi:hypothetical protein
MGGFFTTVWEGVKSVFSLILPIAGKARGLARGLRWLLGIALFAAILVGLYYLNNHVLKLPGTWLTRTYEWQQKYFLPILFVLICAMWWLAWWLYKLLVSHEEYVEFPDINEAWDEACAALYRARIDLRDVPVFLVLGRPEGPMATLFQSSRLTLEVKQAPASPDAPLHVYATRDAVYVTCEGASVSGPHAALLAGVGKEKENPAHAVGDNVEDTLAMTIRPGFAPGAASEVQKYLAKIRREGRAELTPQDKREVRAMMRKEDRDYKPPIRDAVRAEELSARLEHLCRLLVRDRNPYCPINGILVLIPFAATDGDQDAVDAGNTLRTDLATVRRTLQVNAPTVALVCDLETAPGCNEFMSHFSEKQRVQRIGQRFPLVPDLEGQNGQTDELRAAALDGLARWIFGSVVPGWVYKYFHEEKPGKEELPDVVKANAKLFLFMHQLRERQRRLSRILALGVARGKEDGEAPLFGGCYIGGTGAEKDRDQGFVAGVFRRLTEEEDKVSWTTRALEEEANCRRMTGLTQVVFVVLSVAVVSLLGYAIFSSK